MCVFDDGTQRDGAEAIFKGISPNYEEEENSAWYKVGAKEEN